MEKSRRKWTVRPPAKARERPGAGDERWRVAGICIALAAITFAVFGQTLGHSFVNFDDNDYVYENPIVARGLTLKGIGWAFTAFHSDNWHPLTWLSHELDCQFYRLNAGGHHLTSLILHVAAALTLFLTLRRMTGALWRSGFVAAVFAIHPLRVESVAWVAERKDVLCGLFSILTLWGYVRYVEEFKVQSSRFKVFFGLTMLFFVCALMSKPMAVTLPLVLLLLDYWPLRRDVPVRKLVMEKLPMLALSAVSGWITLLAQTAALQPGASIHLPLRLANALVSSAVYLGQLVFPSGLAVYYPFARNGIPAWEVALAGIVLAGVSVAACRLRRSQPWILVGWLWYLVMLLPVAGILQAGLQAHADRYTYLPQIGIVLALTWLVADWGAKQPAARVVIASAAAVVIAALMVCAWKQAAYWQDSETLWDHTIACTRNNAMAHNDLAMFFFKAGRTEDAIAHFRKALECDPTYALAHLDLAAALDRQGKVDESMGQLEEALKINPDYAEAYNNLGFALQQKGRPAEAIGQYEKALQLQPDYVSAQNHLAWLLTTCEVASLRDTNRSLNLARRANQLSGGDNPLLLQTFAAALAGAGKFTDAERTTQQAIDLARAAGEDNFAAHLNEELKRYEAGLPLRP